MKDALKSDAKPVKYRLNPQVKEKVNKEIAHMLAVGFLFPVDEYKWISPIVIQRKKDTNNIRG